jgi:hypothetical protein
VRKLPFLRFEDNESHSEGLYSFNFGDDVNGSVGGDRTHPFIARNLRAWETHYVMRPNLSHFLLDGLTVSNGVYGIYHPDYDAHVYRNISLTQVGSEPINRGHDDESIQHGDFTYENVQLINCRSGRDPLIQLACTSPKPGTAGHFRNVSWPGSESRAGKVVDLGGGPRNDKLENAVTYYFHGYPATGDVTKVVSTKFPAAASAEFGSVDKFTGKDVRAAKSAPVAFPQLLAPVDDLPPATVITSARKQADGKLLVRGVTQDNGEVTEVIVNGQRAKIVTQQAGVADWEVTLTAAKELTASARDRAGNTEKASHRLKLAEAGR